MPRRATSYWNWPKVKGQGHRGQIVKKHKNGISYQNLQWISTKFFLGVPYKITQHISHGFWFGVKGQGHRGQDAFISWTIIATLGFFCYLHLHVLRYHHDLWVCVSTKCPGVQRHIEIDPRSKVKVTEVKSWKNTKTAFPTKIFNGFQPNFF